MRDGRLLFLITSLGVSDRDEPFGWRKKTSSGLPTHQRTLLARNTDVENIQKNKLQIVAKSRQVDVDVFLEILR